MKNTNYLLLIFLVLFQGCSKDPVPMCENCSFNCLDENENDVINNTCLDNYDCTFKVISEAKVDISEGQGVGSGDQTVFRFIYETEGELEIADDEFTNILVLELEQSQTSFSVNDAELADLDVHFRRICFCPSADFVPITTGCIQGEQQSDGTWFLQGNIVAPLSYGDFEVKFDAQFVN